MVADPKSTYVTVTLASLRRKIDELIISALRGNKYTGENGTTASALPSARKIAHGSAGLTLGKLKEALEKLSNKGDGTMAQNEQAYMVITPAQRTDLLGISQITSTDYNTQKTLVSGNVFSFLGFQFLVVDPDLVPLSSNVRYCVAWKKSGLGLAFGKDINARVDEVQNKHYAWATYASMSLGATRIEDEKVVEVACYEA